MSGAIDDEVVRMRFDNSAFARGVSSTIGMLSKLKSSLSFTGADKGLTDLENKAGKFDMSGMNKQIDESKRHWSAWRTAGLIAFATVVHRAVNAGLNVAKAFTLAPIKAGFENYETQINAVQTILANTGLKGKKGLGQVNSVLQELNTYANQTIYSFSEMAKNIGTFTAAGVKLKPATNAIKGIANLAALSGSNSQQASTAMYQLSQAIAANKVGLQDWNSVVNAGMGGKVFQNALFNVGKMEHTLKGVKANETFDQWTKAGNSFRQSLQSGWITGKVLTDTLSQFTGDMTDAQLKAQGYNKQQIKQIQELAKTATGAATHIKTLTQLQDALKEEVATAYGAIFKTIFGDINGATALFTGLHKVLENALTTPIYALNTLLEGVVKLGGKTIFIDAIKLAFKTLGSVLKPIHEAFRDIFPKTTAAQIVTMIKAFHVFIENLQPAPATLEKIRRIAAGVFAVFDIGKQIVLAIFSAFSKLLGVVAHGSGGLLTMAAHIGDLVVAFDKALKAGNFFKNLFATIGNLLQIPLHIISLVGTAISELFSRFHPRDAAGFTNSVTNAGNALGHVSQVIQKVSDWFGSLSSKIKPGIEAVVRGLSRIGDAIAKGLDSQAFGNILQAFQVGLLGGLVLLIKKFLSGGVHVDVGGGIFGQFKEVLEGVTGNLKAMQTQLKAKTLLEIATAMGILAISVVALANINADKLQQALKAMAIGFGELLGSMAVLNKIGGSALKFPVMAAGLNVLAGAMLILAGAVKILSSMSWQELQRGLTAVGVLLGEVSAATLVLSRNATGMVAAGVGITAIAVAMNILALAVKQFSKMSWKDLGKGLAGVGGALLAIAIAVRAMPTRSMVATGVGLLAISVALNAIYLAVKDFSSLSWKEMAKGLVGVAGALVGIALAMQLMPKGMILQAAGLAAIAGSLVLIEKVMVSMAKLSWGTLAKGLGSIAAVLGVLAAAMYVMEGALPGAAAIAIASLALSHFMPVVESLGKQSWGQIAKGLATLAASLAIFVIAGAGAEAVLPGLIALGVAAVAIGAGMALAGVGVGALAAGLSLLAASGSAGIAVLLGAITAIIAKIPQIAVAFAKGLIEILKVIAKNGPSIVAGLSAILGALITTVIKNAPKLALAFEVLIEQALKVIVKEAPKIIAAGLQILVDLLTGIRNNIGRVVKTVADIIVNFLNALARNLPRIIKAGVNLLEKFLIGVASALGRIPTIALKVVLAFVTSLVGNYAKIVAAGVKMVVHLVSGIAGAIGRVGSEAVHTVGRFVSGIASKAGDLARAGVSMIGHVLSGIRGTISSVASKAGGWAVDIGKHIIGGIVDGLKNLAGSIGDKIKSGVGSALGWAKHHIPLIGGPACMVGKPIIDETIKGLEQNTPRLSKALVSQVGTALNDSNKRIADVADSMQVEFNPTVTPVLDLSNVQKEADKIPGMLAATPIKATASLATAASISADQLAAANAAAEAATPPEAPPKEIKFEQNNYSPKALSSIDIYRQTKNQLALAKKALGVVTPEAAL